MEKCHDCGAENPDFSKFCIACGKAIKTEATTSAVRCPACGTEVPSGAKFCVGCGKPIPAQGAQGKQICPSCSAENEIGGTFCTNCGSRLQEISQGESMESKPAAGTTFPHYVSFLDQKMTQAGFDSLDVPPVLNLEKLFRRKKFDLFKVGLVTTFCGVKCLNGPVNASQLKSFSENVFDYAVRNKGYLARNALQPLVVYPVLVTSSHHDDILQFLDSYWPKHWMAFEFPVVIEPPAGKVLFHQSTPLWRLLDFESIKKEAERLFTIG